MHVDNELVEFVPAGEHEFEEVIEADEEEIFVSEEFQEPPVTDTTDVVPAQGKPRCITRIFNNFYLSVCDAVTLQGFYDTHMHIYTYEFY